MIFDIYICIFSILWLFWEVWHLPYHPSRNVKMRLSRRFRTFLGGTAQIREWACFFGCAVDTLWVFQASVLILTNMDLAVYFWMPKKAGPFIHGKCRVCLQLSCWVGFLGKHLQCGANNLTCSTQNHHPHLNKSTQSTSHLAFGMLHKKVSKSNDS